MRCLFRSFLGALIALFLASTVGITPIFADEFGGGGLPPPESINYLIRNGSASISGTQNLQGSGTSISITPDSGTTSPITVDARSVISVLRDIASSNPLLFSISHIGFFDFGTPYAGGLYIRCATLSGAAVNPSCDNWQYTVNGSSPAVGVGLTTVANTNSIQLYFGPSRRITPSSSTVTIGVQFTVTAESYVASTDSWTPAVGLTMRILQGDPFGSPTIISFAATGADGTATFTINTAGSYTAGLAEDFYFPNAAITASVTPQPPSPSVGGGGGFNLHAPFDLPLALAFIARAQKTDGSFDSLLLSDWIAIAFAGGGAGDAKKKLSQYFIASPPILENITDFERHTMALEALGINPYDGTPIDYVTPIVKGFDGTQIGDSSLVNDDIFAIVPLLHAGYTSEDDIIRKITVFIISKQIANGSWENSVDVTAAAIQALSLVRQLPDALPTITAAAEYLHAQEKNDGGFGNSYSTSWALQAITSLLNSHLNWAKEYRTPQYYLATLQQTDGGVEPASASLSTRVWATAYAIPAVEGKNWDSLLSSFGLPATHTETQIAAAAPAAATLEIPATQEAVPDAPRTEVPEPVKPEVATKVSEPEDVISSVATTTEDAPPAPAESSSTPANTQVAAVATIYSDPFEWLLALALLILIAVLTILVLRHRAQIHQHLQDMQED